VFFCRGSKKGKLQIADRLFLLFCKLADLMPLKRSTVAIVALKERWQWVSRLMGFALAAANPRAFFNFLSRLQTAVTNFLTL
jgi:hypothetical protein